MQFDLKQAVATALTAGMFLMLFNMLGNSPSSPVAPLDLALKPEENNASSTLVIDAKLEEPFLQPGKIRLQNDEYHKLWGMPGPVLQPCWSKYIKNRSGRTWGYVLIELANGPHYHRLQVADAVTVTRYLGATLLLPTIKEAAKEPNSNFDKIYDVTNFITSLDGVIRVVGRLPEDARLVKPAGVQVPFKVTADYIEDNIRPVFRERMVIKLEPLYTATSLKAKEIYNQETEAIRCLVMHKSLQFHSQVKKLGEHLMKRVREADKSFDGRFIALDLRVDLLKQKGCRGKSHQSRKCFDAESIRTFLRELGFPPETAIYITQSRWDESLDPLKGTFPNLHTKEYSMPFNEEKQIFYSGKTQFEMAVDFYVCTHSDVFVPAISGIFYSNVAGDRIAAGKNQIFLPTMKRNSSLPLQPAHALSRYVRKKDHPVYFCYCDAQSKDS